jgi:hypothetical protein
MEHNLMYDFAGQIAERKFTGKSTRGSGWIDNRQAVDMAMRFDGSEETMNAWITYLVCATKDLIDYNWCPASITFPGQRQLFLPTDDNYKLHESALPV